VGLFVLAVLFGDLEDAYRLPAWPWASVVISALTAIAFSHVLMYSAMKRIGATIPALVLLVLPFTVLAVSWVVFDERLTVPQLIFGVVLVVGAGFSIWAQEHLA